ncbi:hypothetical protein NIA73_12865 [Anaerobutyricum hallii]|nr:hypothetical protein [Anaerobutyricum hallii]
MKEIFLRKRNGYQGEKIRKGIYAVGIVLLLFLCGISGREYYIRSYPQQYFTYKAKQKMITIYSIQEIKNIQRKCQDMTL